MDTDPTLDPESEADGHQDNGSFTGSSTGDALTLSLFGVMVVIASICLVIW